MPLALINCQKLCFIPLRMDEKTGFSIKRYFSSLKSAPAVPLAISSDAKPTAPPPAPLCPPLAPPKAPPPYPSFSAMLQPLVDTIDLLSSLTAAVSDELVSPAFFTDAAPPRPAIEAGSKKLKSVSKRNLARSTLKLVRVLPQKAGQTDCRFAVRQWKDKDGVAFYDCSCEGRIPSFAYLATVAQSKTHRRLSGTWQCTSTVATCVSSAGRSSKRTICSLTLTKRFTKKSAFCTAINR